MTGAESKRRFDFDTDFVCCDPVAVMRAMNREASGANDL
jgi:hypothetical protein